jgi:hypothetical protein
MKFFNWFRDWFGAFLVFGAIGLWCIVSLADQGIGLPINPCKPPSDKDANGNTVA